MQIKKEVVKVKILTSAEKEFFEFGFEKASLRRIAERAEVTKGNIYTYFASKDALFRELVNPAFDFLKDTIKPHEDEELLKGMVEATREAIEMRQQEFLLYIQNLLTRRQELELLFIHSAGSSLENFREEIFELYTKSAYETCLCCPKGTVDREGNYSEMFIHTMASLYLRFIEEILVHKPDSDDLEAYIKLIASLVRHSYSLFLGGKE